MKSHEIREKFTTFFSEHGHEAVASASLVPQDDPTLLFTNSGMVPFKDIFTNKIKAPYSRAQSVQRCVRAGGKHNDLENVGYTSRHHTFFEMLGNFSFGDYFKEGAIAYAWSFITDILQLPMERLWVTVHESDDEAKAIWARHIAPERIICLGDVDNYWMMGPIGPHGPCSEIYYDHGDHIKGGLPGSADAEGDRYVEIWNLVFMQYETTASGEQINLPKPCVDTGMGLERLTAVLNGVPNNYETDLFVPLLVAAGKTAGIDDQKRAIANTSLRVIADHVRSSSQLIADGVQPSNEGRGYVLRRIIRRGLRHAQKLGMPEAVFAELSGVLAEQMQNDWPDLFKARARVRDVLAQEVALFARTLEQGMRLLEKEIHALSKDQSKSIPAAVVFKLYDTYGFPPDLTADVAREQGLALDHAGFEAAMAAQKERARSAHHFSADALGVVGSGEVTDFIGDAEPTAEAIRVTALYRLTAGGGGTPTSITPTTSLEAGEDGLVLLEQTPFYGESGGQIGDIGALDWDGGYFEITNTTKNGACHLHHGRVREGRLQQDVSVRGAIDAKRRLCIRRAHSATHLMHAALRQVLGEQVTQKGSLVDADRLRFDFSHQTPMTEAELETVERLVNEQIRNNNKVQIEVMTPLAAQDAGALALFGEKYGEKVRVLTMGDHGFSKELCGGTHVRRTGDIGAFRITGEAGVAAGIRRIEATTGEAAVRAMGAQKALLQELKQLLKGEVAELPDKVRQLQKEHKALQKEKAQLDAQMSRRLASSLAEAAEDIGGVKLIVDEVPSSFEADHMMKLVDQLKASLSEYVIMLARKEKTTVSLVASVSKTATDRIKASDFVQVAGALVGAKGGGRAELARVGGGAQVDRLPEALAAARTYGRQKLKRTGD